MEAILYVSLHCIAIPKMSEKSKKKCKGVRSKSCIGRRFKSTSKQLETVSKYLI